MFAFTLHHVHTSTRSAWTRSVSPQFPHTGQKKLTTHSRVHPLSDWWFLPPGEETLSPTDHSGPYHPTGAARAHREWVAVLGENKWFEFRLNSGKCHLVITFIY